MNLLMASKKMTHVPEFDRKTSVKLNAKLWGYVKRTACEEGLTLKKVLEESLTMWLRARSIKIP